METRPTPNGNTIQVTDGQMLSVVRKSNSFRLTAYVKIMLFNRML